MINRLKDFWNLRNMILDLALSDFKTRYAGSYFGMIWAFVQPIVTIIVFWFVFEVGFRAARVSDVPFILWFSCGLIPWFFFGDAWSNATNAYIEYTYLVKKVVFRISILPIIKMTSAVLVHLVFICFLIAMFLFYGYSIDLYYLQLGYYVFCMMVLIFGLSFITSSITPFFRDLTQFINIILQFGMWLTPIMWDYSMIAPEYRWMFEINPVFYIVNGFRDTFIDKICFWDKGSELLMFWVTVIPIVFLGGYLFKKAKPYFSDVL